MGSSENPYTPPQPRPTLSRRLPAGGHMLASSCLVLTAIILAGPGIVWQMHDMLRPASVGRRFATYDPEVMLFGLSISHETASWLAFGAAPVLLIAAIVIFYRGAVARRG
ncbi:hypothetical protein [Aporhodopirellula aestuarii]|uniref:Uncharacterized protein n=1 Tax=Aporhodopirellula aestuarii TaxID=2950107 RepID=A0ABT0U6A9_9BACT|nr:hypothetical protein [Aporhodopirellula aestuarii]MCM2372451.1 hypothetical protein [Aporhodopirellula aestuarii]